MVRFGGRVEKELDAEGQAKYCWVDTHNIMATPYDTPIPAYGNNTVNTLRLWQAKATEDFDLDEFNTGDYVGAVERKVLTENITRVLYPNDNFNLGKELRLKQQYFLVSATIQDAIRRHLVNHSSLEDLADKAVFQLNDTHPALAIAELMHILLDTHGFSWERAWEITTGCMAYTNHTLLPEALEKWKAELLGRLLPRHLMIINEINRRFLDEVRRRFPDDEGLAQRVSIYEEGPVKRVRMAHLAVVGSHSVNGVAAMHTDLLKEKVLPDFNAIWPEKFNNKTNGITQRRWLLSCNPGLAGLISAKIGKGWITELSQLEGLLPLAEDDGFIEQFAAAKAVAKKQLADLLRWKHGFTCLPDSVFDIQIKRIHEYKRQLLNILHVIHLYQELKRNPQAIQRPHTFIFGGKAAPGYYMAKLIIQLINGVAEVVNSDPATNDQLRVFFVPNYSVTLAEVLFPGADVSEQISTAGFEASGTGNMKFTLNGALTLGTLDGANVEIAREVGQENIFIFGKNVDEVQQLWQDGYHPMRYYEEDANIREVIDLITADRFSPGQPGLFRPLVDSLLHHDPYVLFADFEAYRAAHLRVDQAYAQPRLWTQMAIRNVAQVGFFSSDRTIRDYVNDIWKVKSFKIEVE